MAPQRPPRAADEPGGARPPATSDAPLVGARVRVRAEQIGDESEGLARLAGPEGAPGWEVRVPGLLPGELADVRIVARSAHHATLHASISALVEPVPERRTPPCPRHPDHPGREGACGGCPLMVADEPAQRRWKRALVEQHLAPLGLTLSHPSGDDLLHVAGGELGYRWSSKRVAFGGPGRLRLGSLRPRSDRPADMGGCLVDHPTIRAAADELVTHAQELGVPAVDPHHPPDAPGAARMRAAWFKTDGQRVVATWVTTPGDDRGLLRLAARCHATHAIARSEQQAEALGASLRGDEPTWLRRPPDGDAPAARPRRARRDAAGDPLDDVRRVGPLGFLQPNPRLIALAYADLLAGPDHAPAPAGLAFDLYAGSGQLTARMRRAGREVVPCESYPESAAALGVQPTTVEQFLAQWRTRGEPCPALVVANPPRKGLGPAVTAGLRELGAARIHLMSCSARALAADLAALIEPSGPSQRATYRVLGVRGYDALPQTAHVELVAWLERVAPAPQPPG